MGFLAFASSPSLADEATGDPVAKLLQEERRQLVALGANRAKTLAGVNRNLLTRIASMARATDPDEEAEPRGFVTSFQELKDVPFVEGDAEWACLTEALYFEARGESFKGIAAVAQVILNRRDSPRFPDTVCKVVSQGVGGKPGCQFSYKCDGRPEVIREKAAWKRVGKIARLVLEGRVPRYAGGALYYHTTQVRPRWASKFRQVARVGVHVFYRPG